jgi:hypothetical protein
MAKPTKVDLQIRGVPIGLRDKVRRRARSKGVSMSRYVIDVLSDDAERPATIDEWLAEVMSDPPAPGDFSAAGVVREMRDALEEDIRG